MPDEDCVERKPHCVSALSVLALNGNRVHLLLSPFGPGTTMLLLSSIMSLTLRLVHALCLAQSVLSLTIQAVPTGHAQPRPLVIWHGLGDTYGSPGILEFIQEIDNMYPGIFVHSVYIKEAPDEDRKAGYVRSLSFRHRCVLPPNEVW